MWVLLVKWDSSCPLRGASPPPPGNTVLPSSTATVENCVAGSYNQDILYCWTAAPLGGFTKREENRKSL